MIDTKICPKCGKKLPADMLICGYCGSRLLDSEIEKEEVAENSEKRITKSDGPEQEVEPHVSNKKTASWKIVGSIAVIAVVAVIAFIAYGNSAAGKYSKANKAIENADYSAAHEILTEIPEYKDSQRLIMLCTYEQGKAAMDAKDYQKAKELFDTILEYEDAKALSEQSEHLNDVANDKVAPVISGIDEEIDIQSGIEYNIKDFIAEKISISDNVSEGITDYNITCENEAFEQGTGKIDTRRAQTLEFSISAKDEAGNEAIVKTNLNINPIHITRDNPNPVIYDGQYGTVKLVSFTHGEKYGEPEYNWVFECKNMAEKRVMYYFPSTETFIKDYQVTSYYYDTPEVAPGKIGQGEFGLPDEEIPEGVGDYNQIQTLFCMSYPEEEHSFHYISVVFDTNAAN